MTTETRRDGGGAGSGRRSTVLAIVIGVVVLIAIAIGVLLLVRDDSGSETSADGSPAGISRDLYSAWQDGNRAQAEKVATPGAVGQIFAIPKREGDGLEFGGCEKVGEQPLPQTCSYTRPGGRLAITVGDVQGTTLATAVILGPTATTPTSPG
jgi:hypothetical protein